MIERTTGIAAGDQGAALASGLLAAVCEANDRDAFLEAACDAAIRCLPCDAVGFVRQGAGEWAADVWVDASGASGSKSDGRKTIRTPLSELISDAVDRGQLRSDGCWCVAPLAVTAESVSERSSGGGDGGTRWRGSRRVRVQDDPTLEAEVDTELRGSAVVFRLDPSGSRSLGGSRREIDLGAAFSRFASLAGELLRWVEIRDRQAKRVGQLKTVLHAAAGWQRLDDDDELLRAIADIACELLECERASIFLWDRRRKKLIGRPALGIDGDVLEVDDAAGVVGEVLGGGEAKIWNAESDEEARVNRSVDRATEYRTRSLVAVPMWGGRSANATNPSGRVAGDPVVGVFEAINRRGANGFHAGDAVVLADLATHAAAAIETLRTKRTLLASRDRLVEDAASTTQLIGEHASIRSIRETAAKVAPTDLTALILGQNGTGKEVLARNMHYQSERCGGPFIAVNCAALVESLLESELFGHERGAFTDAHETRVGKFESAGGGTLFLDEVGDMSPGGQAKLLRVLEEKLVVRVGGWQAIPVDVRVIAATNQPLDVLVRERRFREDLFFRLNVVSLTLPALSERGGDVLLLAEHFLADFCAQIGRRVPRLTDAARDAFLKHHWPGNVRELRNTIERVCYLTSGDVVDADDLMLDGPLTGRSAGAANDHWPSASVLAEATREFQVAHIDRTIAACNGNMTDAANRLGLHRSNLYRKMRQLGMPTSNR